MKKSKQLAIKIIDLFEDILRDKNITIPDIHREGNENEARIYGETYYSLEDKITEKIEELLIGETN